MPPADFDFPSVMCSNASLGATAAVLAEALGQGACPDDPGDHGTMRAGISLSVPTDRGPERRPGTREHELVSRNRQEEPREPTGRLQIGGPSLGLEHSAMDARRPQMTSLPRNASNGDMDFGMLQQLISRGIASAEAGEEPDIEVDNAAFFAAPSAERREVRCTAAKVASLGAQVGVGLESAPRTVHTDRAYPSTGSKTPRRTMAEVRAAAERRRAAAASGEGPDGTDQAGLEHSAPDEPRSNMAAIRAIAERRAMAGRAGSAPRQALPSGSSGEPNAGWYRPTHVYSSRSSAGGGVAGTLGLRYSQPPPGRRPDSSGGNAPIA